MKILKYLGLVGFILLLTACTESTDDSTPSGVPTLSNSTATVKENAAVGTTIGTVTIRSIGDSAITAITLSGTGSDEFQVATDGTIKVVNGGALLDYETTTKYNLTAVARNSAGNSSSVKVDISVTDVLDTIDNDNDYIPDSIEKMLGMSSIDSDEDGDGVVDGLQIDGSHGDTFFDQQWHLKSLGTVVNDSGVSTIVGNDLNLFSSTYHQYMGYNNGNPIIVQVVDDGVDADHEDLKANMDLTRSYKHTETGFAQGDPSPTEAHSTHGTMVAGIMGARAFNGIGVRGIAPFVKIAGSNWLAVQSSPGLEKVWLSGIGANEIAVTNNSWGGYISNSTMEETIMEQGTSNLRDGKGRIYVFAAGNSRGVYGYGNANLSYSLSNRYPVVVAALKNDNTHASYSTPGGNILITGYSGDFYSNSPTIGTTTVEGKSSNSGDTSYTDGDPSNDKNTWSDDTKENYTYAMNGTSAASPVVASSIALVLEACPSLTWRDVKYLLAKHGDKVDSSNSSWVQNGAGLWHSVDYGFGLIDTKNMIADCTGGYTNLGVEKSTEKSWTFNDYALGDDMAVVFKGLNFTDSMKIEWVELTLDADHDQPADYTIELQSPAGTVSKILDWNRAGGRWMDGGFRVGAAAFMDEDSAGEWKIRITDNNLNNEGISGTLKNLKIKIYGH